MAMKKNLIFLFLLSTLFACKKSPNAVKTSVPKENTSSSNTNSDNSTKITIQEVSKAELDKYVEKLNLLCEGECNERVGFLMANTDTGISACNSYAINKNEVVTNYHCIEGLVSKKSDSIRVVFVNERGDKIVKKASVLKKLEKEDLAILKLKSSLNGIKRQEIEYSRPRNDDEASVVFWKKMDSELTYELSNVRIEMNDFNFYHISNYESYFKGEKFKRGNSGSPIFYKDKLYALLTGVGLGSSAEVTKGIRVSCMDEKSCNDSTSFYQKVLKSNLPTRDQNLAADSNGNEYREIIIETNILKGEDHWIQTVQLPSCVKEAKRKYTVSTSFRVYEVLVERSSYVTSANEIVNKKVEVNLKVEGSVVSYDMKNPLTEKTISKSYILENCE